MRNKGLERDIGILRYTGHTRIRYQTEQSRDILKTQKVALHGFKKAYFAWAKAVKRRAERQNVTL